MLSEDVLVTGIEDQGESAVEILLRLMSKDVMGILLRLMWKSVVGILLRLMGYCC